MTYLVDTNVISGARRFETEPGAWLRSVSHVAIWLSVITIGEIVQGVALRRRRDPAAARVIDDWLRGVRIRYRDRILPITDPIVSLWGELAAERPRPTNDCLLAATALVHDLVVVTRNVRDFEGTGVRLLNPWSGG